MSFYGRERELSLLQESNWRDHAQLIVVHGRRRVGKTALVEQAYRGRTMWSFDGLEGGGLDQQLAHFHSRLQLYAGRYRDVARPRTWDEALRSLAAAIGEHGDDELVVFFDEFQWMVQMKPAAVSVLKSHWDSALSKHRNLRLVLCGSISSFLVKKVIRSRALYGRVSTEIELRPLSLDDAAALFEDKRSRQEVIAIAMTLGTVPQYLEELNPRLSLSQNLNESAFSPHGFFFGEYQRIFISHFGRNPLYERVLDRLASGPQSTEQLATACQTRTGGTFTAILQDLTLAGFIERYSPLNKGPRSRQVRYRVLDEYLHFYARFIKQHEQEIISGRFSSLQIAQQRSYPQWRGFAFERLCRRNAALIADRLRFSGIQYRAGSWFQAGDDQAGEPGAQVDLLFDRADRVLTLCEAKYSDRLAGKRLLRDLDAKCQALSKVYPRHGIQRVLLLGKDVPVPAEVASRFDDVLRAVDVLF